jgi:hypothetical protein
MDNRCGGAATVAVLDFFVFFVRKTATPAEEPTTPAE